MSEQGVGITLSKEPRMYHWNSRGKKGSSIYSSPANDAKNNNDAAFPDGLYDITVTAKDLMGNAGDKTVRVLLDNWKQTDKMAKSVYGPNEDLVLQTGEQYRAGQPVNIYLVRGRTAMQTGDLLDPGDLRATVTADANGRLPQTDLGTATGSPYCVVADYDGDGEFTEGLDAVTVVWVLTAPGLPADVGGVTLSSSPNPIAYGQQVTLTATAYPADPADGAPYGQVAFYDGTTYLGQSPLYNGVATLTVDELLPGDHDLSAHYINDVFPGGDFAGTLTQTVNTNATATTLTVSSPTADANDPVDITASVAVLGPLADQTPTGRVDFYAGDEAIGSADLDGGTITIVAGDLPRGDITVTGIYTGDGLFEGVAGWSPSRC